MTSAASLPQQALSPLTSTLLKQARHGFFTREGGVSTGPYASLNCSVRSEDTPAHLRENRRRIADWIKVPENGLTSLSQVHGKRVITVTEPLPTDQLEEADAMVTRNPAIALGTITADCAPVLFASADGQLVGAAHAGWRGALAGVIEATLDVMQHEGAPVAGIYATVGPCIAQSSYETGEDMHSEITKSDPDAARFFMPGKRTGHYQFDLGEWCLFRLKRAGVQHASLLGVDTFSNEKQFFSHRRRTLTGNGPLGHQLSVISPGARA
ncbi:peptidoglycan editing factor PgeF [Acetobacter thailandicus]|uniref:peptidoglycan editing factor PgeF n=1 Tax=Acetobacter thailandicus TaxID=1502842 RepID=UPI001BA89A1E|nr:peptidoglycan editing factor PgeF [Acetobacter thailandicus]MBS0979195.1 peptidoglycan editing factor PgeF [Acetobacter thailandicus]